jgi:uncharacterized protein (DUF433 family)
MDYRESTTIAPRVRSGKPCICGPRISVADVFDYLGDGMSIAEILDDFPDLTDNDIRVGKCLSPACPPKIFSRQYRVKQKPKKQQNTKPKQFGYIIQIS